MTAEPLPALSSSEGLAQPLSGAERANVSVTSLGSGKKKRGGVAVSTAVGASLGSSQLRSLSAAWEDVQRTRLALKQRGMVHLAKKMVPLEAKLARDIKAEMKRHPIGPWLSAHSGLGGVHAARLVGLIDDPWRFPGAVCPDGHHHNQSLAGQQCPVLDTEKRPCLRTIEPPRPGTGVRSVWHYLGLHVVDGRSPRKRKGSAVDWNPRGRTVVLMPGGIAEQIVRHQIEPWVGIYYQTKERLTLERLVVTDGDAVTDSQSGPASPSGPDVENVSEGVHSCGSGPEAVVAAVSEAEVGLRPFQIDAIARKVAAKAFVADMLMEWKRRTGHASEVEDTGGPDSPVESGPVGALVGAPEEALAS